MDHICIVSARFASTGQIQPARIAVANSPAFLDGKEPENKKFLLNAIDYGIDYRDIGDHEILREGTVGVIMLGVASRKVEIATNIGHAQYIRVQLLQQIDDPAFLQSIVGKPRGDTGMTVEMPTHQTTAVE